MREKLRRIDWWQIVTCLVMATFMLGIMLALSWPAWYITVCSLIGTVFALNTLFGRGVNGYTPDALIRSTWWVTLLGAVSMLTLLISAVLLPYAHMYNTTELAPRFAFFQYIGDHIGQVWMTYFISAALQVFVYTKYWSTYRANEDRIIFVNGKVFFPGEEFKAWPFTKYDVRRTSEDDLEDSREESLDFKDGNYEVEVNINVELDLEEAKERADRNATRHGLDEMMKLADFQFREGCREKDSTEFLTGSVEIPSNYRGIPFKRVYDIKLSRKNS